MSADLFGEQRRIDESLKAMVDEIIDGLKIRTVAEGIRAAKAWCTTAAQETSNSTYWRERTETAEAQLREAERLIGAASEYFEGRCESPVSLHLALVHYVANRAERIKRDGR